MIESARANILDCPFDRITMAQTVERCLAFCRQPRASHTIVTLNTAGLVMMRDDESFRQACLSGDLIVADGVPVLWAGRLLGEPLPGRVAGVDLMAELLAAGAREGLRVYLLGAKPEIVDALLELCRTQYPGLVVAGTQDGYFDRGESDAIVAAIREAKADILFIGMPSPFKEVWAEAHKQALETPVIIGVGGSFDVLTGHVQRAPLWMQKSGLEWSWRLMMEPRKMWRRYLVGNSRFIFMLLRALLQRRPRAGARYSAP